MSIIINHKVLSDSPFNGNHENFFVFNQDAIDDIVHDIYLGQPTCYLISGYRGSGKTSFIKKVEIDLQTKIRANNTDTSFKHIFFVYTNFSRYESQTYLLRKLIRGLFFSMTSTENKDIFDSIKRMDESKSIENRISTTIETLFLRTFHDISSSRKFSSEENIGIDLKINFKKILKIFLKIVLPIFVLIFWSLNTKLNWFNLSSIFDYLIIVLSGGVSIFNAVDLSLSFQFSTSKKKEFSKKTLYDDEIADYHFNNILKLLSDNKFKVVFVLDELDKVEDKDADKLIKEMKPYLVSGLSSFIVVAGQQLYYKYYSSQSDDDSVLSTLFSRMVHISLFPISQLQQIFKSISLLSDEKEIEQIQPYLDYLKYKSKLVPRRFINLIRQEITWTKEKAEAVFNPTENMQNYSKYSKILSIIQNIYEKEIESSFDEALCDYFLMQLFIKTERILRLSSRNFVFTKSDI